MASNILMVAPQPFFRARGTPFSVLHRIRALLSRGHEVTLVTYPFGEDVEMDGLSIIRAGRPPLVSDVVIGPSFAKLALDIPLYFETAKQLRNGSFDVIHSHEEAAFFCVGLARLHNIPHIYDMHSSLPQQLANFGRFNLKPIERFFLWQENRVLGSCDGVITICNDLADIIAERCPSKPHAMIENTGDDACVFAASDTNVRRQHQLEEAKIVLYTGTFEAYQGLELLREAFKLLAGRKEGIHLLLVGGSEQQVEDLGRQFAEDGTRGAVTMVGTVHPSEIPAYFEAADVIVSPRSSGTNTPLKIYGYMRSGKPIVATDRLTHTQTLTADTAELVPPTAQGLADGIDLVLENPARARSLVEAAKEYIEREYSDSAYIEKVNRLYDCVLSQGPGGREPQPTKTELSA